MSRLLTSYSDTNKVTRQGKTQTITCETSGNPVITIVGSLSGDVTAKSD